MKQADHVIVQQQMLSRNMTVNMANVFQQLHNFMEPHWHYIIKNLFTVINNYYLYYVIILWHLFVCSRQTEK